MSSPFHRLLTFFSTRSTTSARNQSITFIDSLRGDLSIGLNFPIALFLAVTRHLVFRNTGAFSLTIHVPTVKTSRVLLGGPDKFDIEEKRQYGLGDLLRVVNQGHGSLMEKADAIGCWGLVARRNGKVLGGEVRAFQKGEIMEIVTQRRRGRDDVLPFWRGGPISVTGHSWLVKRLFDVDVYRTDLKSE